jgi:long-chain acyl-CoA synthetase
MAAAWRAAEAAPRRTFMVDGTGELSYGETCVRIRKLAGLLEGWGLRPGARVLLASREDRSTAVLFLALLRCGLSAVLLDPDTGPDRARRLIGVSAPDAFLVQQELIEPWGLAGRERVLALVPEPRPGFLERLRSRPSPATYPGCLAGLAAGNLPERVDPELDAYVLFTSGTTSDPKGVRITQRGLFSHLATLGRVYGFRSDSCLFNNLILSHTDGINQGPVLAFVHGLSVVRPFPFQIQTMAELLDAVYRHRVSHLIAVPTMLALLARYCSGRRDAFLTPDFRMVVSCGAYLESDLWQRFEQTFGVPVVNLYGLTETVTGGLFAGPDDATRRYGTVGRPVDCEARILADGRVRAAGEPGELQLRGAMVMAGYLNAPEATARVLDAEGWLSTGDLAVREADGCYRILGRCKALIIRGGFNVHPEEVTEVLLGHPGVLEAVTFGLPDPIWGEQVASAVVAPGLDEAALMAYARARLEGQKVPSRIAFLPALPRGRSGKVVLEAVRDQAAALLLAVAPGTPAQGVRDGVLAEAALCFHVPPAALDLETTADDCPGWDSMAHLEFVAALEARFGIELRPDDILAMESLADAVRMVAAQCPAP